MDIVFWLIFSILVAYFFISLGVGYKLFTMAEAKIKFYENFIRELKERVDIIHATMVAIDIRGSFEADDEIGDVFKRIKQITDDLSNYME